MDNFSVDNGAVVVGKSFLMLHHPPTAGKLARAAGYLCSAQDELAGTGYAEWAAALCHLLETINIELAWLQDDADTTYPA